MVAHKVKIFNDPVYGFISVAKPSLLLDLIDHPYFQRLQRIGQTALSYYVYPGAHHTRFLHALGAYHLMTEAIVCLRQKGIDITEAEAEGVCIAILLHDIGHGPFSHTLEHTIIDVHHEDLTVMFMHELNRQYDGLLTLALSIFQDTYAKRFLHQLVSGQLDMDRMDYLSRDAFFTGVSEGVIGYDRIIKMLNVVNGELVVEEKGIYSIEKFLIARRLMYWQVYLHKTGVAAEQMLIRVFERAKELCLEMLRVENTEGVGFTCSDTLLGFISGDYKKKYGENEKELIESFAMLDDYDIIAALKLWTTHSDFILSFLSRSILNRRLFKLEFQNEPFDQKYIDKIRNIVKTKTPLTTHIHVDYLVFTGKESNLTYNKQKDEIKILTKNNTVCSFSDIMDYEIHGKNVTKYYLCYPKYF